MTIVLSSAQRCDQLFGAATQALPASRRRVTIKLMKSSLALGSALALALVSSVASAANVPYKAALNGKQEAPANASAATGVVAALSFNDAANGAGSKTLTGTITLAGITSTAQHIHIGACGTAGAVAITLPAPVANVITINAKLNGTEETALAAGTLYFNVHSAAFGGGEIRGQIAIQ